MFPRCGVPDHYGDWRAYTEYVEFLERTASIIEHTQIWWSVRPHLGFGTVEVRIMDAQSRADESTALLALASACVAQAALDYDDGRRPEPLPPRVIEENLWRAIRYGLDGKLIDFAREVEVPAAAAVEKLVEWTQPASSRLGLEKHLAPRVGCSMRATARSASGAATRPDSRRVRSMRLTSGRPALPTAM